jgi:hypothetical protein
VSIVSTTLKMVALGDAGAERSSTRRLHVGGLSPDVLETDVAQLFAPFGKVRTVELVRDAETAGCRGFAYVSLEATDEQVNKCFKDYARAKWRGRQLTVAQARPSYLERLQAEWDERLQAEVDTAEKLAAVPEWQGATAPASEWTELSVRRGYAAPLIVVKPGVTNQHCWSPKGGPLHKPSATSHSQSQQPHAATSEDEEELEAAVTATVQRRDMKSVRLETAPPLKSVLKPTSSRLAAPKAAINRSLLRADLAAELDEELAEAAGLDVQLLAAALPARRAFGVVRGAVLGAVGRGREFEENAEDDEEDEDDAREAEESEDDTAQPWVDQGEEDEEDEQVDEREEEEQREEEEAEADENAEAEGKADEHYGDDEGITTEETDMALSVLASLLRPKPAAKAIKPATGDKGAPTKRPLSDQPSPEAPRGVRKGTPSSGSGSAGGGIVGTAAAPVERSRTLTVAEQAAEERKARYGQWASSKVWQVGARFDPSAVIDEPEPFEFPHLSGVGKQKAVLSSGRSEAEEPPKAKKAKEPPKGKQKAASPVEEAPASLRSSSASGPTHQGPDANVPPKRKEVAAVGARRSTRAKEPKPEPEPEPEPKPEPPKKKAKGGKAEPQPECEDKPSGDGDGDGVSYDDGAGDGHGKGCSDSAGSGASKIVDVKGGGSLRSLFLGAASTAGFSLMGSGFSFGGAFDGGEAATTLATPAISEAFAAPSFDSTAPWTTAEVWAAPPMQAFMRKASEEDLRENWVAGRRDARSAYKKRHQDAVRQQKLLHGQRRGRSMRSNSS